MPQGKRLKARYEWNKHITLFSTTTQRLDDCVIRYVAKELSIDMNPSKLWKDVVNPPHISDQCPLTVNARINGPPPGRPDDRPVTVHPHIYMQTQWKKGN